MKYIINTIFSAAIIFNIAKAQVTGQPPAQMIPQFQLFTLNNKPFTDKDLPKGKMVFLIFFDPGCDHCQRAIKSIGDNFQAFKNIPMFMISMFEQNKINQFMDTYGSKIKGQKNVTILQDKLRQFIIKFNPVKYPSMFLYAADRTLLAYDDNPESLTKFENIINKKVKQ